MPSQGLDATFLYLLEYTKPRTDYFLGQAWLLAPNAMQTRDKSTIYKSLKLLVAISAHKHEFSQKAILGS